MQIHEELSPAHKSALMEKMNATAKFWSLLGMELVDVKKGWAKVRLPFVEKLTHPLGIAHGGAIFSPADSAVAMAYIAIGDVEVTNDRGRMIAKGIATYMIMKNRDK